MILAPTGTLGTGRHVYTYNFVHVMTFVPNIIDKSQFEPQNQGMLYFYISVPFLLCVFEFCWTKTSCVLTIVDRSDFCRQK